MEKNHFLYLVYYVFSVEQLYYYLEASELVHIY